MSMVCLSFGSTNRDLADNEADGRNMAALACHGSSCMPWQLLHARRSCKSCKISLNTGCVAPGLDSSDWKALKSAQVAAVQGEVPIIRAIRVYLLSCKDSDNGVMMSDVC